MNKKMSSIFIVSFILVFAVAFANITEGQSKIADIELKNRLSESLLQVLDKAESVTGFVAKNASSAVVLNPDQIIELKNSILSDKTYMFDLTKEVIFVPSVSFIFEHEDEQVLVSVSYHAEQIAFQYGDQRIVLDCDPGFEVLNKNTKSVFKEPL